MGSTFIKQNPRNLLAFDGKLLHPAPTTQGLPTLALIKLGSAFIKKDPTRSYLPSQAPLRGPPTLDPFRNPHLTSTFGPNKVMHSYPTQTSHTTHFLALPPPGPPS